MTVGICSKKLRFFALLCFTTMLLSLVGCGQGESLEEKGRDFVKTVLAAPSDQFAQIEALQSGPKNMEEYEKAVTQAMEDLCGGSVSKEALANTGGTLYQNILLHQVMAVMKNATYEVGEVTVTKAGEERNYHYQAKITASNAEEPYLLTGSIQFDEDGLINYFSMKEPRE